MTIIFIDPSTHGMMRLILKKKSLHCNRTIWIVENVLKRDISSVPCSSSLQKAITYLWDFWSAKCRFYDWYNLSSTTPQPSTARPRWQSKAKTTHLKAKASSTCWPQAIDNCLEMHKFSNCETWSVKTVEWHSVTKEVNDITVQITFYEKAVMK